MQQAVYPVSRVVYVCFLIYDTSLEVFQVAVGMYDSVSSETRVVAVALLTAGFLVCTKDGVPFSLHPECDLLCLFSLVVLLCRPACRVNTLFVFLRPWIELQLDVCILEGICTKGQGKRDLVMSCLRTAVIKCISSMHLRGSLELVRMTYFGSIVATRLSFHRLRRIPIEVVIVRILTI